MCHAQQGLLNPVCANFLPSRNWVHYDMEGRSAVGAQALAEQEPGLQAGEGWFDACSEGSQATGARRSPSQRHSEYSACLGEAQYSAAAHALSFLCAVAPQASLPRSQISGTQDV